MKLRSLIVLAAVVAIGLVVADVVLWRTAQAQLAAGWNAWVTASRAQGWTVSSGPATEGGWPLGASRTVTALALERDVAGPPGGLGWRAERLTVEISLLHPRSVLIATGGAQRLRLGTADIPYAADSLQVRVPLTPGVRPRSFRLQAADLRAGLPGATADEPTGAVTIGRLDLRAEWTPAAQQNEPAATVALDAGGIGLPASRAWPLGPTIDRIAAEGSLGGPLPLVADLAARAAAWRDGGGAVDVRRLAVAWGPLDATVTATLALDEAMQPMGTGHVRVVGAGPALDTLVANRAIGDRTAVAAKALLGLMTHAGAPEVELPLTLQDRRLTLGRIPLARVPDLVWPK